MIGLERITTWLIVTAGFAAWSIIVLLASKLFFSGNRRRLAHYRFPLVTGLILAGLAAALKFLPLEARHLELINIVIQVLFILVIVIFANNLFTRWLKLARKRSEFLQSVGGIFQIIFRIVLFALGFLIILQTLNIKITTLLASLGIGSLAVALALQDTLANFFAGLYILADKPIKVGDFVRLETGEEGYIEYISWRSTRMRMLPNNLVVIPNSKLGSSTILNYNLPAPELSVLVQVGVSYDSDLEFVEKVTIEVAKEVQETVEGAVKNFTPFITYHTFADSSINFTVIMRASHFVAGYLMKHEFIQPGKHRHSVPDNHPSRPARIRGYRLPAAGQGGIPLIRRPKPGRLLSGNG